jgi:addiction module HigA family antidote
MPMHNPPHPGIILKETIANIPTTVGEFAAHLGVARSTLSRILNGRAGITAEMSIKLSEAFGQGQPDLWFKMQNTHDFWQASQTKRRKKVAPLRIAA